MISWLVKLNGVLAPNILIMLQNFTFAVVNIRTNKIHSF